MKPQPLTFPLCGLKCLVLQHDKNTCRSCVDRPDIWSAGTLSARIRSRSSFLTCFSLSNMVMAFFSSLVWYRTHYTELHLSQQDNAWFIALKQRKFFFYSINIQDKYTVTNTFRNSLRDAEIFGFGFWKRRWCIFHSDLWQRIWNIEEYKTNRG